VPPDPPWRRHADLVRLAADWQRRLAGHDIVRVAAGPGWLGMSLAGESRTHLTFTLLSGAVLLWDAPDFFPIRFRRALGTSYRPPVAALLGGARLLAAGVLPTDRVFVLAFGRSASAAPARKSVVPASGVAGQVDRYLLQQLFGPRGNLVILDGQGQVLWARQRPPHHLLTVPPATALTVTAAAPAAADIASRFRTAAVAHLTRQIQSTWYQRLGAAQRRAERAQQRLVTNLNRDLQNADRGDEHRRLAETLAAHLHEIPRGTTEVVLPSPHDGQPVRLLLNPALTPTANLKHYFHLARKAARGRSIIASRLATAQDQGKRLARMRQQLNDLQAEPGDHLQALLDWVDRHGAEIGVTLPPAGKADRQAVRDARSRSIGEPARSFRRYLLEDSWEVWVGRDQRENDELTHHRSAPDDLWFHAQGVGGSHVILRTAGKLDQVPARVIAKTAALAALHSKAHHSSLVPVVYTRRKYVRKPRKTPPGTASYSREKSVMVKPGVMPGVKLI